MSMMPGNPCHRDADFPYMGDLLDVCPECKGRKFYYSEFIDGKRTLVCDTCNGEGTIKRNEK